MTQDEAETVALQALAWLAGNDELLPVFLGATGADAADLRERAAEPDFLASVLDFLTMDDAWIGAFCAQTRVPPEAPMRARRSLPGGDLPHWT